MPVESELSLDPLPPEEAIAYFKDKILLNSEEYYSLLDQIKTQAFTVSRVAKMDILEDIYDAIQAAIDDGKTLADFMDRLGEIMDTRGWSGLSPWHAETVFRTNIQTANSVGHEQQAEGTQDSFPYAEYDAVNDDRVRPEHLAMDGKIFPVNHSFWDVWTPPSGYNCFPLGSMVHTSAGLRSIESIGVNDWVIGGSGNKQRVTAVHRNIFKGDMVRLSFKDGVITSTPNHRILTMDGWKRSDAIQEGDILIQTKEGVFSDHPITDAFSFNGFDMIDDFRDWATSHAILHRVNSRDSVPYIGTVVNFSIEKDKSYIVNGVTVHNCRCQKRYIHKYEAESRGLKIESIDPTGSLINIKDPITGKTRRLELRPDKGFEVNPAKHPWKPNKEDYPEPLWNQYQAELKASAGKK